MARIEIPQNAEDLMKLGDDIYAKHQKDGSNSPLNSAFNMGELNTNVVNAEELHEKALDANRQKENFYEQRNNKLKKVKKEIRRIRDYLLSYFPDNPHILGDWGFEVKDIRQKENNSETTNDK